MCGDICSDEVARLLDDTSTHVKLQNAVSAVVDWRLSTTLIYALSQFLDAQLRTHKLIFYLSECTICLYFMTELSKID